MDRVMKIEIATNYLRILIMGNLKQEQWYADQKTVSINKDIHNALTCVRKMYIKRYHRNITLGNIIELIIRNDTIITALYNEYKSVH